MSSGLSLFFDWLCEILLFYSVEKDNNEEKTKISSEGAHKVLELQKKIDHARELVSFHYNMASKNVIL